MGSHTQHSSFKNMDGWWRYWWWWWKIKIDWRNNGDALTSLWEGPINIHNISIFHKWSSYKKFNVRRFIASNRCRLCTDMLRTERHRQCEKLLFFIHSIILQASKLCVFFVVDSMLLTTTMHDVLWVVFFSISPCNSLPPAESQYCVHSMDQDIVMKCDFFSNVSLIFVSTWLFCSGNIFNAFLFFIITDENCSGWYSTTIKIIVWLLYQRGFRWWKIVPFKINDMIADEIMKIIFKFPYFEECEVSI